MTTDQKNEIILKLLDEKISGEEFQHLQQLLLEDDETVALYREHIVLDSALNKHFQYTQHSLRELESKPNRYKKPLRISLFAAAACVIISLVVAWFIQTPPPLPGAGLKFAGNSTYTLSGGTGDTNGSRLEVGAVLHITEGAVKLDLPKKVSAVVIAPAVIRVQDDSTLALDQGKASFVVPEVGKGFTVITPRLKAVDLGTEFVVISGWRKQDEVHVTKGAVKVSTRLGLNRVIKRGGAVAVGEDDVILETGFTDKHSYHILPDRVDMVFEDSFEEPLCSDKIILHNGVAGWGKGISDWQKTMPMTWGVYNPSGDGTWYENRPELDDGSSSNGLLKGMKGPCLAFFLCNQTGGVQKDLCQIKERTLYTASVTLGVRRETQPNPYGGYHIALMSGDTVLQSVSGTVPPCSLSDFTRMTITWDSSKLPSNIREGDKLTLRILNQNTARKLGAYLDFDNVRVTRMKY